jgi:hypothetical protein
VTIGEDFVAHTTIRLRESVGIGGFQERVAIMDIEEFDFGLLGVEREEMIADELGFLIDEFDLERVARTDRPH